MGRFTLLAVIVLGVWQAGQQPPRFRADTAIVPVDVRVLDKDGRPVTDLTRDDFTITEDGVPQVISQFNKQLGDATTPAPRWIVIVLGEGRLQEPFKAIDALEAFIRTGLRSGDHLGVIAYNRWSDFTTDRDAIVALLERYKARTDRIQTTLETYSSGLREETCHGDGIDVVQDDVDWIFRTAPGGPVREFAPGSNGRYVSPGPESQWRFTRARFNDVVHLYGAIEYLRLIQGDKHVIALVEQGSPARGARSRVAMIAADQRVALHIVQTGGFGNRRNALPNTPTISTMPQLPRYNPVAEANSVERPEILYPNIGREAREAAAETGGLSFFYTDLRKAFAELASAISLDYLLGYTPSNQLWKGEYRAISVQVKRPDVTVVYRHGYHAVTTPVLWDDRAAMTDARLSEARTTNERAIGLQLKAMRPTGQSARSSLNLELEIEPSQVAFTTEDGRHVASLDVEIWVSDARGQSVGELQDRIDLRLTDTSYAQLTKSNISYTRRVALTGTPVLVRAAVYDYDNDRIGTVITRSIGR